MPAKIIFSEEFCQPENLFPFTLTRQIQDIRLGILTIREKWEQILKLPSFDKQEDDYKDFERSVCIDSGIGDDICLLIHGNILPTKKLIKTINKLKNGEFISVNGNAGIVYRFSKNEINDSGSIRVTNAVTINENVPCIQYPWEIFQLNDFAIRQDFYLLTKKRKSRPIPRLVHATNKEQVFIEKGAEVREAILNTDEGPIYIGKNSLVMEGTMIRGPVSIGAGSVIKMGTRIYGATTIGPGCIIGGEVKNSVIFGNSNKAHDGYLGDSVIGEWCNLGAGTSNSNIKNNASLVKVWTQQGEMNAGLKCGAFIGDFSKTSINTSINTGTVIGVCSNVFGHGLTPKYIPSFSWGSDGIQRYKLEKALVDIEDWKQLKKQSLTQNEITILKYIFEHY